MPWYPSAKACPAAIKPTVQCFFPTLYQVLLFDFSSFGEKLFFCLRGYAAQSREARCKNSRSAERGCSSVHPPPNRRRMGGGSNPAPPPTGYRRAIARSAVQKTAGAQSEDVPLLLRRRTGGEWVEVATLLHHQQAIAAQSREARCKKQPERRALRPQARFGAQPPQAALGAEIGCSSVHPPPNRRRMGGGDNLALLLGKAANPAPPPTSYRRAKLALNVRIGCSYRAHNHHKFSHRILQPHTKRRASHAD